VDPAKLAEYRRVLASVDTLLKREQELLLQFTPENSRVRAVRDQLAVAEKNKARLETETPELLQSKVVSASSPNAPVDPNQKARENLVSESTRVTALVARIKILSEQLDTLRKEASSVYELEGTITELQRNRDSQENRYKYYLTSYEQTRAEERLGAGKVSNISKIQTASPPYRDSSKVRKAQLGSLIGGFALAVIMAFLLEFYVDSTVKRPADLRASVSAPLFMAIPAMRINGSSPKLLGFNPGTDSANPNAEAPPGSSELAPWQSEHQMRPFAEALRDRLMNFFEVNNMTHKPKLVAVTSCGKGAGVSSVAAGLAASLSETGEGNVLLVDMNQEDGAAHQFHRGDLAHGIDDALEKETRDSTMVHDNLYVVSEDTKKDRLPSILPRRFKNLVPRLKASDYDYIIFDMPPVSQVSITPRLARFMDMNLLVVEAEKTSKDVVKQASDLLTENQGNVGLVLNKGKTYIPKGLVQHI
jgi:Mrp family chromosome partitioning ATPase